MCAPRRAAAVVRPRGREKSADRRRRILISRLLIIRASVPRRKSPFPACFKGFPAVSPLIPPYPAFLKYPVSPHTDLQDSNEQTAAALKTAERRLSDLALLIKHTATYKELKPLYSEYKKSRDKEKYLRGREREIILFEASARALKAAGVGDKLPDLAKLREEYSRLSEEKDRLYAEYGSLKKRMREYDAVKQNIDSILSPNRGQEQDKAL
jgi:hypothetical protein